jgi:hypothetical protein
MHNAQKNKQSKSKSKLQSKQSSESEGVKVKRPLQPIRAPTNNLTKLTRKTKQEKEISHHLFDCLLSFLT